MAAGAILFLRSSALSRRLTDLLCRAANRPRGLRGRWRIRRTDGRTGKRGGVLEMLLFFIHTILKATDLSRVIINKASLEAGAGIYDGRKQPQWGKKKRDNACK